jgi:hypothetical protein
VNRCCRLGIIALSAALASAGRPLAGAAVDEIAAAAPLKDPCSLLKPADIQALDATAKIGNGKFTNNPPLAAACVYRWGPRTSEWGETELTIDIVDAAQVWPGGLSAAQIKQQILGEIKIGGPDATEIAGVGDGALFTTEPKSHNAKARAFVVKAKGVVLEVAFHGGNALAQKDKLVALLKTAVAAL